MLSLRSGQASLRGIDRGTLKAGLEIGCCRVSFFFSSRRRHTRCSGDWSSDVCSSDLVLGVSRRDAELERLQPDADASDRAMMVRALDVDRPCEPPLPFVDVIGDVREEIDRKSVV